MLERAVRDEDVTVIQYFDHTTADTGKYFQIKTCCSLKVNVPFCFLKYQLLK